MCIVSYMSVTREQATKEILERLDWVPDKVLAGVLESAVCCGLWSFDIVNPGDERPADSREYDPTVLPCAARDYDDLV